MKDVVNFDAGLFDLSTEIVERFQERGVATLQEGICVLVAALLMLHRLSNCPNIIETAELVRQFIIKMDKDYELWQRENAN
jgi:hypothetical protein